jgi:diadenosine tetraphosphate (Ap4A) HIT family hydrolase
MGCRMTNFTLHERLAADTIEVTQWPLSLVLLMNARQWPWLILVPRRPAIREIYELAEPDQHALMSEIVRASERLTQLVRPDKINVAALGNAVPQLHVHVIARFTGDPAWPKPVWGTVPPEPYAQDELGRTLDRFRRPLTHAG